MADDGADLYALLGVERTASESEIKKSYRKKAMKVHPDRNPAPEAAAQFQALSEAHEILSDDFKRQLYDDHGLDAARSGEPPAQSIFDILNGGGRSRRRTRTDDQVNAVLVDLADLYNGMTQTIRVSRQVVCGTCNATGGRDGAKPKRCQACEGQGAVRRVIQMGFMIQQMMEECDECNGRGESIAAADKCTDCKGRKVKISDEELEINVDKGMRENQKIVLRGKANEAPGLQAGDLVFVVREGTNDKFKRDGDDLHYEQTISLTEALCGFDFVIEHMDGRKLHVRSEQGEIISPSFVKGIPNEGMPKHRSPFVRGTLWVKFAVEFPEDNAFDAEAMQSLLDLLPPRPPPVDVEGLEDVEEVSLSVSIAEASTNNPHFRGGGGGGHGEAYDEDEYRGGGGMPGMGGGGGGGCPVS